MQGESSVYLRQCVDQYIQLFYKKLVLENNTLSLLRKIPRKEEWGVGLGRNIRLSPKWTKNGWKNEFGPCWQKSSYKMVRGD